MKALAGEWRDLKDWMAYLIDMVSREKHDATAMKFLIILALIVIPVGLLLQSSDDALRGVSAIMSPIFSLFGGLLSGQGPAPVPDDRTYPGMFEANSTPTPNVWHGNNSTPTGSTQVNTTPAATSMLLPRPGPGTSPAPGSPPAPA